MYSSVLGSVPVAGFWEHSCGDVWFIMGGISRVAQRLFFFLRMALLRRISSSDTLCSLIGLYAY